MAKPTKKRAADITTHDLAAANAPAVDWSEYTDDQHIGADLDCALRKLIVCGMNPTDAVQVLGELATDSEKPRPVPSDELFIPMLTAAAFHVGPQTEIGELLQGAELLEGMAHRIAMVGSGAYDADATKDACIDVCARLLHTSTGYRDIAKQIRKGGAK